MPDTFSPLLDSYNQSQAAQQPQQAPQAAPPPSPLLASYDQAFPVERAYRDAADAAQRIHYQVLDWLAPHAQAAGDDSVFGRNFNEGESANRGWSPVARQMRERFPGIDPEQYRSAYDAAHNAAFRQGHVDYLQQERYATAPYSEYRNWAMQGLPFVSTLVGVRGEQPHDFRAAQERIGRGQATEADYDLVARFTAEQQRQRQLGQTFPGLALQVAHSALPFVAEMLLTGGTAAAARQSLERRLAATLGEEAAASVATRVAGYAAQASVQSALTPSLTAAQAQAAAERNGGEWYSPGNLAQGQAAGTVQAGIFNAVGYPGGLPGQALGRHVAAPIAGAVASDVALHRLGLAPTAGSAEGLGTAEGLRHLAAEALVFGLIGAGTHGAERLGERVNRQAEPQRNVEPLRGQMPQMPPDLGMAGPSLEAAPQGRAMSAQERQGLAQPASPAAQPVGAGRPPREGLVVAMLDARGRVYYGQPGENHGGLVERFGDFPGGREGFAGPDGRFLSREEALQVAERNQLVINRGYLREPGGFSSAFLRGSGSVSQPPAPGVSFETPAPRTSAPITPQEAQARLQAEAQRLAQGGTPRPTRIGSGTPPEPPTAQNLGTPPVAPGPPRTAQAPPAGPRPSETPHASPPATSTPVQGERIVQAAFRDPATGVVYPTGKFHDIEHVPRDVVERLLASNADEAEGGFLTNRGRYLNRDQAMAEFGGALAKAFEGMGPARPAAAEHWATTDRLRRARLALLEAGGANLPVRERAHSSFGEGDITVIDRYLEELGPDEALGQLRYVETPQLREYVAAYEAERAAALHPGRPAAPPAEPPGASTPVQAPLERMRDRQARQGVIPTPQPRPLKELPPVQGRPAPEQLRQAMDAAVLTPQERHVVLERSQGRPLEEIAHDPELGRVYTREGVRRIEQRGLDKLGVRGSVHETVNQPASADRRISLAERGELVNPSDLHADPETTRRAGLRLDDLQSIESRIDKLTEALEREVAAGTLTPEREAEYVREHSRLVQELEGRGQPAAAEPARGPARGQGETGPPLPPPQGVHPEAAHEQGPAQAPEGRGGGEGTVPAPAGAGQPGEPARGPAGRTGIERARRGRGFVKEAVERARAEGIPEEWVHQAAREILREGQGNAGENAALVDDIKRVLLSHNRGMSRQGLDRLIGRWRNQGGDWGKFRGMDLVDREVDGPHQQILRSMVEHSGDRVEQVVFDLLTEGKQHQGEEAAYREAVDRLIRERPAESPPPDAGEHFDERGYLVDSAGNILFHEGPTQARPAARPAAGPGESPGVYGLIATIRKLLDVTNYTEARVPGSETAQAAALLRERATVTQKMQAGNWRIALEEAVHLLSARTGFEADPARLPEGVAEGFRQFFGPGKPLDARAVLEGLGQWAVRRAEGSLQGLTAEQVAAARHAEAWARESGALEALDRIGHLARAEEGGPATRQAAGMIGRGAEPALTQGERARSAWERLRDWFQDNVTDNLAVLRRAGMDKAHTLYSRLMFAERSTAQEFAERGVWTVRDGKKEYIGPALEAITRGLLPEDLAPHQGEVSKASVFAIARHVIWEAEHAGMLAPPHPNATRTIKSGPAQGEAIWEAQARPTVSPEQLEVYRRAMAEFQKDPQFARRATAFADRLTQAYNATRRALASPDVHRLDPAVVEYYEKLYPHYVPLERVLEPGGWRERQGVRGENMPKVFHQRTGSGEQIVDPLVSYQKRLQVTAAMLHEQLRRNAWAEYLLEPGHGDYGIPFETGEQALTPYGKVSKRQLENIGLPDHEVANILREMGGTAYMQEYAPWPKDGTRPTVEWYGPGGKRMDFRIGDRAFYDLVTGQQGESNSAAQFFRWMGKLGFDTPWGRFEPLSQSAGLVRKGATAFSLGFQVRNALSPFRDPYEFLKNTSDRASVARLPEMLKRAYSYEAQVAMGRVPADEVFALFVRERGEAQRQFATEVPTLSGRAELLGQILEKGRRVLNTLGAGELAPRFLEFVNRLGQRGWSERRIIEETRKAQEAARIGEYYRDPVPWDVLQDAMEAANEVTVPFNRQGVVTREINKLVPFFGPQVAGMSKAIRNWRTNPAGAAIGLGAVLTLRLMHWLAFHDQDWYGELQAHDRYNNFVVPVPGLGLRRIPGPRDLEVPVGGFLTALLDAVGKKHPDFAGLVSQSAGAILPPPPIPPALAVTWQVGTNRDWTGRPIVPRGDEQAPGAYNLLHHQGPYALGQLTGGRGELSLRGTGLVPFSQVRDANRSVVELYDRLHSMEWERQKARRQGVVYPREAEYQRLYHAAHEVSRLGQEERGLTHQGRSLREGPQPAAGRQEQIRRQQAQLAQQALR